jgi:hypothetical protein
MFSPEQNFSVCFEEDLEDLGAELAPCPWTQKTLALLPELMQLRAAIDLFRIVEVSPELL